MRKLFIVAIMILLFSSPVMAQGLGKPWLLPDNFFYPLQRVIERIQLMFTFDSEAKARLHLQFAERRLAELNETLIKNQTQYIEKLNKDYENEMNETEKEMNITEGLGRNVTALAEHVAAVTYKHILVLERVLEKVPDQAKSAIEHAINVSQTGHEQAVESIFRSRNITGIITLNFTIGNQTFSQTFNVTAVGKEYYINRTTTTTTQLNVTTTTTSIPSTTTTSMNISTSTTTSTTTTSTTTTLTNTTTTLPTTTTTQVNTTTTT